MSLLCGECFYVVGLSLNYLFSPIVCCKLQDRDVLGGFCPSMLLYWNTLFHGLGPQFTVSNGAPLCHGLGKAIANRRPLLAEGFFF